MSQHEVNSDITASSLLPLHGELIRMISRIALSKPMVWVANSRKVHSKFTVWAHLMSSVHYELTECPQNEPTVSFNVSSQLVSCELTFFTQMEWLMENFPVEQSSQFICLLNLKPFPTICLKLEINTFIRRPICNSVSMAFHQLRFRVFQNHWKQRLTNEC